MKFKPKFLGLLGLALSALVLSLLLVACGGDSATPAPGNITTLPATTSADTTDAATTAAGTSTANPNFTPTGLGSTATAATAPVAVVDPNLKGSLLIWDALPDSDASMLRDQITAFGKAYPGLKVTLQHYAGDELVYATQQAAKAKKLPDLFLVSTDYQADLQAAQAIQPADKSLDKSLLGSFADKALAGSQQNGTQWGVPFTYGGTTVMLYNKKLISTPPTTWSELGKTVQPLYDAQKKQIGLALDVNEPYFLASMFNGFGGSLLDSQNKPTLDSPQMVSALGFIEGMLKDKTVRSDSRLKDNQIEYAFRDGRLGIYITSDALINQYANAIDATTADAKLDLGIAPLPKIDANGQNPAPFNNGLTFYLGTGVAATV